MRFPAFGGWDGLPVMLTHRIPGVSDHIVALPGCSGQFDRMAFGVYKSEGSEWHIRSDAGALGGGLGLV